MAVAGDDRAGGEKVVVGEPIELGCEVGRITKSGHPLNMRALPESTPGIG